MTSQNILSVLKKMMQFTTVRHPLACFGIPGFIVTILGIAFLIWIVNTYQVAWTLPIIVIILLILTVIFGIILIMASLIFYALSELRSKIRKSL